MSIDFASPSFRAAGQDLTVSISPLGLVELADEEFEIHGPRLNRYSINWATYLGHHYSYRAETGEEQPVYNYYRAFTDFLTRFTFGQGVQFSAPDKTAAIVPHLLKRVWETDNDKMKVLFEMGTSGAVSGDCFVKIAYEEPYEDSIGRVHPGRVRILPLNAAYCFPEYHPHDRSRLVRMKIKYRFWGTSPQGTRSVYCVDDKTEALTREGWKKHSELSDADEVLAVDAQGTVRWEPVLSVHRFDWDGPLTRWQSTQMDALTTPNHRWLVENWRDRDSRYAVEGGHPAVFKTTETINTSRGSDRLLLGGSTPQHWPTEPVLSDELVELLAWTVNEGHFKPRGYGVMLAQSQTHNPEYCERIRVLAKFFQGQGHTVSEYEVEPGKHQWYFGKGIGKLVRSLVPDKRITPELLTLLTEKQARLFYDTCIDGDGHRRKDTGLETWIQKDQGRIDGFQMLVSMLGMRTSVKPQGDDCSYVSVYRHHRVSTTSLESSQEHYEGVVWCPKTPSKTWLARRNGKTYFTGNTYVEILTEDTITEYINDEMIDQRPNPLGVIPVVHIPNMPIPSSPWGLSDCQDIIQLNLQYNAINKDISDIVNYHSAPVTVIVGAKASQLEKGAKKVWGGLPKEAQVFNLEGGGAGLQGALEYLEKIKRSMHEIVGIPETALGQVQPISNTSGVALSIQFQPLMNRWAQKTAQYGDGLQKINELILLSLAVKEPDVLTWVPNDDVPLEAGQVPVLDPNDPATYLTTVHFPPPLPLDKLVVLNEIQMKMQMNLESREGALRTLGEEYPKHKLSEISEELMRDALSDGALQLLRTQIQKEIMDLTAMMPGIDGGPATPLDPTMAQMSSGEYLGDGNPQPPMPPVDQSKIDLFLGEEYLRNRLVSEAYQTKRVASSEKPSNSRDN